jgi:hypothetical protein
VKRRAFMRGNKDPADAVFTGTLAARMQVLSYNPLTHAAFACRWGNGAPKGVTGPRQWLR